MHHGSFLPRFFFTGEPGGVLASWDIFSAACNIFLIQEVGTQKKTRMDDSQNNKLIRQQLDVFNAAYFC